MPEVVIDTSIMDQPTLTPSAASSFLPTMPTSWFSSLETQSNNPTDRDGQHRLSSESSGENDDATHANSDTADIYLEKRQPVTLKPLMPSGILPLTSTIEEYKQEQLPLPHREEERGIQQHYARMPMNAPQLRMRPVAAVAKDTDFALPSPIARRGEAERAFLQRQMKAEAIIRREQARHNRERKIRENHDAKITISIDYPCKEEEQEDDELPGNERQAVSDMAQQSADGKPSHLPHFLPNNRKHSRQQFLREFASSPPLILKKSFKRSVSAVLADLGLAEDENLLFFPDGLPLLNEQEEVVISPVNDFADGDSALEVCSPGGGGDDGSVDASDKGITEISPTISNNEPSPSLIAADVIWQIGASSCDDDFAGELPLPHQFSKKVTLRPKMNAPCLTSSIPNPMHEFDPISAVSLNQANKSIGCNDVANGFSRRGRFSREILSASESFQHLAIENADDRAWGMLNRSDSMGRSSSCGSSSDGNKVPPFTFSSPEPGGRNRRLFGAKDPSSHQLADNFQQETSSESDYCTPDNSESKRHPRKILSERLPKLPELGMPTVQDSNDEMLFRSEPSMTVEEEDEEFEIVLNEDIPEINFYTPEISKH